MQNPARPRRPPRQRRRRRTYPLKWVIAALLATAAVLIGGPYLVINLWLGSAPSKLTLPPAQGVSNNAPLVAGPVSGTWVIAAGSIAGYRVQEVLFGQSHTAVGRTEKVTGGMMISGTEVTAADFTVDMSSVKSDQGSRDAQFRGFIMQTSKYPHGSFRLTKPIQLGSVPAVGHIVTMPAVGNLTLRGQTRAVSFSLKAERTGSQGIDLNAEIPITFGRWGIPNPSFAVAHLGNTGTVEVLLKLAPEGSAASRVVPSTTSTTFVSGKF